MRRDFVVVLNYNGWDDTDRCVRSLLLGSPEAQILVVDNGSAIGFPADTASRWPGVVTHRNAVNLGFAGGMNTGIRLALESAADTITVLNNDTFTTPGAIVALGDVAQAGMAVSPEVHYLDRPNDVWFGGGVIDPDTNLPHHVGSDDLGLPPPDGLRPTVLLAGCCVTATAATWTRVGPFDERYFLNFEDSDWSLRAREAGVALVVDTRVTIGHAVSASFTGAYSYLGLYFYARNGLLFGRERCSSTVVQKYRFLRQHVVPNVIQPGREGHLRESVRRCYVLATALRDFALSRFGPAPRRLARRCASWSA